MRHPAAFLLALAWLAAGWAAPAPAAVCANPDVLHFAIIPSGDAESQISAFEPLVRNIEAATRKKVEIVIPPSYASVISGMAGDAIELGRMGPASYVIAHAKNPQVTVFATYDKQAGYFQEAGPGYRAVLIVRNDSPYRQLRDLRGKTVALTDPASTSGSVIPRRLFPETVHQPLERYFGKTLYSGEHDLSVLAVQSGKVATAFVATHELDNVIRSGRAAAANFRVLWRSPLLPQDPFVYNTNLCPSLQSDIRRAFFGLGAQGGAPLLQNLHARKFVPMQDASYDIIRKIKAIQ